MHGATSVKSDNIMYCVEHGALRVIYISFINLKTINYKNEYIVTKAMLK